VEGWDALRAPRVAEDAQHLSGAGDEIMSLEVPSIEVCARNALL